MAACCCCTCTDLNALIACDAITIDGFSRIGDWVNMTPYTGCCWRGFFVADNCEPLGPLCHSTPCTVSDMRLIVDRLKGVNYYIYRGCMREIWIWRDFYSTRWANDNLILDCNHQLGCGYFLLTRWVDYAKIIQWEQWRNTYIDPIPNFLSDCPIGNCLSTDQCTETSGDVPLPMPPMHLYHRLVAHPLCSRFADWHRDIWSNRQRSLRSGFFALRARQNCRIAGTRQASSF
jgi:hypothetical protein